MQKVIERLVVREGNGVVSSDTYKEHIERYKFAILFIKSLKGFNKQNMKILDIACGSGYGTAMLMKGINGVGEIWGGDVSKETIKLAQQKYSQSSSEEKGDIYFKVMDATQLPFEDNYFEAVVGFETIEHIKDYERYLEEIFRVMKDNGIFIISTPNRIETQRLKINNPHHLKEFSYSEFRRLLDKYFSKVDFYGQRRVERNKPAGKLLNAVYKILEKARLVGVVRIFTPLKIRKRVGRKIDGVGANLRIEEFNRKADYMYFVAICKKEI